MTPKIENKTALILTFLLILISDDTVLFGTNNNTLYTSIKIIFYLICCVVLGVNCITNNLIKKQSFIIFVILCVTILMSMLFNQDIDFRYAYKIFILLLCLIISSRFKFSLVSAIFTKFIYIISCISLFVYALVIIFPSILDFFPLIINKANTVFYNLYICVVFKSDNYLTLRNTSIFREPGVFMEYLVLAIFIEAFYNKTINKKRLLVFVISLITTYSTTGVFILILSMAGLYYKQIKSKISVSKIFGFFIITSIVIYTIFFNNHINSLLFNKLSNADNVSTIARVGSLKIPIAIFFDNILIGVGISSFLPNWYEYSHNIYGIILDEGQSTNTLTNTFAMFGFSTGIIYILGLYGFSGIISHNTKTIKILTIITLGLMFSSQNMPYSIFFNLILIYGISFYKFKIN